MNYLNLPNGRFAYIREGQGAPVLLLHGLGSSLLDWQPQIEHLAQHCEAGGKWDREKSMYVESLQR